MITPESNDAATAMTAPHPDCLMLQSLLIEARQTGTLLAAAMDQNHRLIGALKSFLEMPFNTPLNGP